MHNHNDIETMLEESTPTLSDTERASLWNMLSTRLGPQAPIHSPFMHFIQTANTKVLAGVFLILVLILGGGGTTLAAQGSRPGDLLFPIERAFENTRLEFTRDDTARNELKMRYADERLTELQEIIDEEAEPVSDTVLSQETNEFTVATGTPTTDEHRNRGKKLNQDGEVRVAEAVDTILGFLDETDIDDTTRARVLKEVFREIDGFSLKVQIEDDRGRGEREDDDRGKSTVELEDEDDDIRMETRTNTTESDGSDDTGFDLPDNSDFRSEERDGDDSIDTEDERSEGVEEKEDYEDGEESEDEDGEDEPEHEEEDEDEFEDD